jgi:hypothetical protein
MDVKIETEKMKEDAKKLFKEKEARKEFTEFCDKKLKDYGQDNKHTNSKDNKIKNKLK